jgi:hypothetical protein
MRVFVTKFGKLIQRKPVTAMTQRKISVKNAKEKELTQRCLELGNKFPSLEGRGVGLMKRSRT